MGEAYTTYEVAFRLMADVYPVLGIIHFDAEHTFSGDRNVFDYMTTIRGMRLSRSDLIKRYGRIIAKSHRALLIKVEKDLLGAHPILPPDLSEQRAILLRTGEKINFSRLEPEPIRIPIDLSATNVEVLNAIDKREIIDLRSSEEGVRYFKMIDDLEDGNANFQEVAEATRGYAMHINLALARSATVPIQSRGNSYVEVLRAVVSNDNLRE